MTENPSNNKINQALEVKVDSIDMSTQVKLNELRHAAINQSNKTPFSLLRKSLAGIAVVSVIGISLLLIQPKQQPAQSSDSFMFEDLELLANEADTDFYQDLEFLNWLNENEWSEIDI